MLIQWLSISQPIQSPSARFSVFRFSEYSEKSVGISELKKDFIRMTANMESIKKAANEIGFKKSYSFFVAEAQPTTENMIKGRFGEVLFAGILEDFYGYIIPVYKLRYNTTANQSQTGTDILGIKMNGDEIAEVCFIESKLRIPATKKILSQAFVQLMKDQTTNIPEIFRFVINRLYERDDKLATQLLRHIIERTKSKKDIFRIGTVFEKDTFHKDSFVNLHNDMEGFSVNLNLDLVDILQLNDFINDLYEEIGEKNE